MSIIWVYTCSGTRGEATVPLTSNEYGTCNPASEGSWIEVSNDSYLTTEIDGQSFADLLTTVTVLFALVYTIKMISDTIRGKR